jgi:hypothetical protein
MKKLVLISCFFLSFLTIKAQDITGLVTNTNFNYQMITSSQYNFTFHAFFSFGFQSTCPALINSTFSIVNDTLVVKGFYDITGAWPQAGCNSFDTVIYSNSIPSNIHFIEMSTNVISYNNTPPYIPSIVTYENVYHQTFEINPLNNSAFNNSEKNIIYPNPTNGTFNISNTINYEKIIIYNTIGQNIKTINKITSGKYEIGELHTGIYNVLFLDENNIRIGETKLIKN